jgi:hypothetical protein
MKATRIFKSAAVAVGSLPKATPAIIVLLGMASSANAAAVLLGGFDGLNAFNAPRQDASITGIVVTLSTSFTTGSNNNTPTQSSVTTWGTKTFAPAPDNSTDRSVVVMDTGILTITLQITNNNLQSLTLDQLHWRAKRDGANSPTGATIAYVSGDLAETGGTNSGVISLGDLTTKNFDYSLSSMLSSDRTLATGETATFTFTSPSGGTPQRLRIDNFAISGELIPEPSSALLGAIGLIALLRRRR